MNNSTISKLLHQADVYKAQGYRGDEEQCLQQILKNDPHHTQALLKLADIRTSQNRHTAALPLNRAALKIESTAVHVYEKWIENTNSCRLHKENLDACRRLLCFRPNDANLWLQYSDYWFRQDDYENSYPHIKKALEIAPNNYGVMMAMAKVSLNLRRLEDAELWFEKSIKAMGNDAYYQWEYAMFALAMGQFEKGWQAYEARLKINHPFNSGLRYFPFPFEKWEGQSLKNKTILVHGEQGFGDDIMFGSMLQDLVKMDANVLYACVPQLLEIFQRSFPDIKFYGHSRSFADVELWNQDRVPKFLPTLQNVDYQSVLPSLAKWLRPNIKSFNTRVRKPYLKPCKEKSDRYKKQIATRIRKGCKYKVGLIWTGNLSTGKMGEYKSIALEKFVPLARDEVQYISLHNADHGKNVERVTSLNVMDFCDQLIDFDETAALIDNCDLVISIDTSVCHLSAALGKQTWVPLRLSSDWRYILGRDDCVWYSSMRLFSQTIAEDWTTVIESLGLALDEWLEKQKT